MHHPVVSLQFGKSVNMSCSFFVRPTVDESEDLFATKAFYSFYLLQKALVAKLIIYI